jgi:hypothetical protein
MLQTISYQSLKKGVNKKYTHQPSTTSGSLTENAKLYFMHIDVSKTKGRK